MGANQTTTESARYFKLIGKPEKGDKVTGRLIKETIKDGETYKDGGWYSSLSGRITAMNIRDFVYENKPKKSYRIKLKDDKGEVCVLEFSLNIATYGLINSLLNADLSNPLEISAYTTKKGYAGVSVNQGAKVEWAIALDQTPKPQVYDTPEGPQKSYIKVNEFWHTKFEEVALKLSGIAVEAAPASEVAAERSTDWLEASNDDDLPF